MLEREDARRQGKKREAEGRKEGKHGGKEVSILTFFERETYVGESPVV